MTHLEPIESEYFNWLVAKVMRIENSTPSLSYLKLLRELQNTEFVWVVPMDENRAEDGIDLRHEFINETQSGIDSEWLNIGCSILEMLIAFTRRASFVTDRSPRDWFWDCMENLGLSEFNDAQYVGRIVDDIVFRLIWRTYDYDGSGGMFPLHEPEHDQRKVEIWYQFCEYLVDQE